MSTINEAAQALAQAIKASPECMRFRDAETRLKADPASYQMAQEFFGKQIAVQTRQMMGQSLSEDEIAAFNTLANAVMANSDVANYIQAQMAFFKIYQDVLKTVNDAAGLDLDMFGNLGI